MTGLQFSLALGAIWVVSIACGVVLGRKRDQTVTAALLTLFLGPLGLLIFAFLPNEKQESEEHARHLDSLEKKLADQRDEQSRELLEQAKAVREAKSDIVSADDGLVLRIARNGEDLGEMKMDSIRAMLGSGQLVMEDFYLDPASNEWMPLDCHPALTR